MFLSSKNYFEEFRKLVESNENLSLAVAFWGQGAQTLINKAWQGQTLRILCNLGSGGTNPQVIRDLIALGKKKPGLEILTVDDLHAKVAIGETTAIVGSANISVNGLGLEGAECAGWQEAGVLVNDQAQVSEMLRWFEHLWRRGEKITDERLDKAQLAWLKNRRSRPLAAIKLIDASINTLRNRDIHVAVYRLLASEQAEAEADKANKEAQRSDSPEIRNAKLHFFEDWPDDCNEPLPKGAPILAMRYGPTKRVTGLKAWVRVPQLDRTFISNMTDDEISLTIVGRLDLIAGLTLSDADASVFAKRLKPWIDELYEGVEPEIGQCKPLDDFLMWEENRQR